MDGPLFCRWCTSFNQKWVDLMAKTARRCNGKISPHFLAYLLIFRNTDQQGPAFKKKLQHNEFESFLKGAYLFLPLFILFVCLSVCLFVCLDVYIDKCMGTWWQKLTADAIGNFPSFLGLYAADLSKHRSTRQGLP